MGFIKTGDLIVPEYNRITIAYGSHSLMTVWRESHDTRDQRTNAGL